MYRMRYISPELKNTYTAPVYLRAASTPRRLQPNCSVASRSQLWGTSTRSGRPAGYWCSVTSLFLMSSRTERGISGFRAMTQT